MLKTSFWGACLSFSVPWEFAPRTVWGIFLYIQRRYFFPEDLQGVCDFDQSRRSAQADHLITKAPGPPELSLLTPSLSLALLEAPGAPSLTGTCNLRPGLSGSLPGRPLLPPWRDLGELTLWGFAGALGDWEIGFSESSERPGPVHRGSWGWSGESVVSPPGAALAAVRVPGAKRGRLATLSADFSTSGFLVVLILNPPGGISLCCGVA